MKDMMMMMMMTEDEKEEGGGRKRLFQWSTHILETNSLIFCITN
jgi:hypothetical protein